MTTLTTIRSVLFWFLSLAIALVSWRFLVLGVPASPRPLALYAHIGLAPVALALMPVQFLPRLRARRPGLHRWTGRAYALAILISGVAGLSLALGTDAGPVAATGFALLAVLWLAVTGRAVWLAMAGRIAEHRRWMIRSAALTFAAVTLRLELPLLIATLGFDTGYPIVAWLCWVPNLALTELWLARRPALPARA